MLPSFVLSQPLIRTLHARASACYVRPLTAISTVNPLESALPKNARVTPLQSAVPKSLGLKSFRIRTSEKKAGGGGKLLTRIEGVFFVFVTSLHHYILTSLSRLPRCLCGFPMCSGLE